MDSGNRPSIPLDGPLAPPRRNGEIVFDAPWESRAFGIAAVLQEHGCWTWEQFAARFGAQPADGDIEEYYRRWLASLESLLIDRGLLTDEELDARVAEYSAGIHDHD
jgi:nitrile hydratase accessory protein